MDHSIYDKRRYPIVDVREGYGAWVRTYEETVQDEMDLRLLDEGLVDGAWLQKKPKLQIYAGLPISFSMVWRHR